jgi:hypothetical protein
MGGFHLSRPLGRIGSLRRDGQSGRSSLLSDVDDCDTGVNQGDVNLARVPPGHPAQSDYRGAEAEASGIDCVCRAVYATASTRVIHGVRRTLPRVTAGTTVRRTAAIAENRPAPSR